LPPGTSNPTSRRTRRVAVAEEDRVRPPPCARLHSPMGGSSTRVSRRGATLRLVSRHAATVRGLPRMSYGIALPSPRVAHARRSTGRRRAPGSLVIPPCVDG
jgi:hypothetical protein